MNTLMESIKACTPSLAVIRKEKGDKYVESYLKLWIIDLQSSINVKTKLNEDMIDSLALMLLDDFRHLTISDIKNVVTWAKKGKYGEFYESLSIHKIYQWFNDYFNDRCEAFGTLSENEHYIIKRQLERNRK